MLKFLFKEEFSYGTTYEYKFLIFSDYDEKHPNKLIKMGRANTAKSDKSEDSNKSKKGLEYSKQTSKKAQYGCQLAPRLPQGITLQDVRTQKWTLGKAIGSGGFGDIYLCSKSDACEDDSVFVVKLEPHANGPLFTEMHCLLRLGLQQHREDWKPRNGEVGWVAMPLCHGNGSVVFEGVKLRFLVIDRLGSDLDKFFGGGEKPWPIVTVLKVAMMVVDSLEFVHSKGYAHNDIKVGLKIRWICKLKNNFF